MVRVRVRGRVGVVKGEWLVEELESALDRGKKTSRPALTMRARRISNSPFVLDAANAGMA
eukprot:scaffold47618_cov48-Phaeocystis_antarctica.AAC.1